MPREKGSTIISCYWVNKINACLPGSFLFILPSLAELIINQSGDLPIYHLVNSAVYRLPFSVDVSIESNLVIQLQDGIRGYSFRDTAYWESNLAPFSRELNRLASHNTAGDVIRW